MKIDADLEDVSQPPLRGADIVFSEILIADVTSLQALDALDALSGLRERGHVLWLPDVVMHAAGPLRNSGQCLAIIPTEHGAEYRRTMALWELAGRPLHLKPTRHLARWMLSDWMEAFAPDADVVVVAEDPLMRRRAERMGCCRRVRAVDSRGLVDVPTP